MRTVLKLTTIMGGSKKFPGWTAGGLIPSANVVRAYIPKGAADIAASYSNLSDPGTGDAAPGAAPSFDTAIGWSFTESGNTYLTTGYLPTTNNMSIVVKFGTITALDASYFCGMRDSAGANRMGMSMNAPETFVAWNGTNSSAATVAGLPSNKTVIISNKTVYIDGVSSGTIAAGTSSGFDALFIGAANTDGSRTYSSTVQIAAMFIYDVPIASYVAALQAYFATL